MSDQLTSTTAPGRVFQSRAELAEHYKSDWHKYNLKRREAGLPLLREEDFRARLEAALALRQEREGREERSGKDHLKNKKDHKYRKGEKLGGAIAVSQAPAYDRIVAGGNIDSNAPLNAAPEHEIVVEPEENDEPMAEEETPVIDPRQCLFDKHMSPTLDANIERMARKYGFFIPDQEYLVEKEGLLGYCHEKIKLGHCCLYCQKLFSTWQGCQKHMISTRHTKLRYERGVDMEEYDPFFDFSEADAEFLGKASANNQEREEADGDEEWEDVTDDEAEEADADMVDDGDDEGLYAGYEDEIARFGFHVTPLGELVFPDGRIVGHRGLARYYKQRVVIANDRAAVLAARRAAGERLYRGRVYNANEDEMPHESALALARAGVNAGVTSGRAGNGLLVNAVGGGYTALSLYRFKAVVKKARRDDARGQRLKYRTTMNTNRMDKKANRLMNGVSVAHAKR